jgi:CBS-domain-containing membrane protein
MLRDVTRSKLIQVWFAAIALAGAAVVAFGPAVTLGTAVMVFAVSLVPPAIALALWPEVQPRTASDVLHGTDRSA